jgi:Tol biopolymer transport system component
MPRARAFLLFILLLGPAVPTRSADDGKTNGRRVLIKQSATLFVTDPEGTTRSKIADNVWAAALSPDGNLVAYADRKTVNVFSLTENKAVTLAQITEGHVHSLAWSPDQKHLAYDVEVRMKSWSIYLASYPPSGNAPRDLGHWYETISFSPNGKFIVHPSFNETDHDILEAVNEETGKRETIFKGATTIWQAKYSPDGSSIAFMMTDPKDDASERDFGGSQRDLWVLPSDSRKAVRIMSGVFDFDWSPDGKSLAIGTGSVEGAYPSGDGAVFISSADGKVKFQLSKHAPSMDAKFSPDSKKVMFVDFYPPHFVIGDLATRKLTPMPAPASEGDALTVYDWK